MYKEADGYGWTKSSVYSAKEINEIEDPTNTKKSGRKEPKVSVPSPFARFELVQKAFSNVASFGIDADSRDRMLVSHALDVMQLWYEGGKDLKVVEWSKRNAIRELKTSKLHGHRLYGKALELYMRQENYGFDEKMYMSQDNVPVSDVIIYILTYQGDPVGCTSPTSFFMATPNYKDIQKIKIEGDIPLFGSTRMLYEREEAFIEYVYRHLYYMRYKGDNSPLAGFKTYLDKQKSYIRRKNEELYSRLNQMETQPSDMDVDYTKSDIQVLGYPIYQRKEEDQQTQIKEESDFVINSSKSTTLPLVLSNNGVYNNWAYTSKNKLYNNQIHKIKYTNREPTLPGTDVVYEDGWLCEDDFLSSVMVMLPYPLDKDHFFDGNIVKAGKYNYLLPIKPKYFDFFDYDTLYDQSGGHKDKLSGREDRIRIEEEKDREGVKSVTVTLLIPVRNGKIVRLRKVYRFESDTNTGLITNKCKESQAVGTLVECPIALNIFPFFRLKDNNYYDFQVIRAGYGWDSFKVKLIAVSKGRSVDQVKEMKDVERSKTVHNYSLRDSFDYLRIQITDEIRSYESILIPKWADMYRGSNKFRFSFDFGTTNTYIAVQNLSSKDGFKNLELGKSIVSTLDQKQKADKLYADDMTTINQLDVPMRQEFLPAEIGTTYSFPLRTVVLKNSLSDFSSITPKALLHVNIPFVYGKEDYGQANQPKTDLKWSKMEEEQKLSKAFIEELVLLARAYALENGGDLSQCFIVWTYPLSMNSSDVGEFEEKWKDFYRLYFNDSEDDANKNIIHISESVAPLLYYRKQGTVYNDMTLSIDIGGGTCDVVAQSNEEKIELCSFRFAADVIFGAGKACENPMIQTHYKHFTALLAQEGTDESTKVRKMLEKICEGDQPSTEANTFLFGLESHPALARVSNIDDKSFNARLKKDRQRKIIFLYFYGAIIFYLTRMLCDLGYKKPVRILFSGTGSKLLNIIGSDNILSDLTTEFMKKFSGGKFDSRKSVEIIINRKEPKQLTAKGALCDSDDEISKRFADPKEVRNKTIHYQLIKENDGASRKINNEDLKDVVICTEVVKLVEEFNRLFIECISELSFDENFGCDEQGLGKFINLIEACDEENLLSRLDKPIKDANKDVIKNRGDKVFEDVMFFYPIKDIIQKALIPNIKK